MRISKEDVGLLEGMLVHTEFAKEEQIQKMNKLAPGLVNYQKHTGTEFPVHIDFYSRYNTKLNIELSRILKIDNSTPLTIHTVNYDVGGEAFEHIDGNSFNTFVIMLDDNYEGGHFYVEGNRVAFDKRGDVAHYVGCKQKHKVTPVTKGTRKVLVVWYGHDGFTPDEFSKTEFATMCIGKEWNKKWKDDIKNFHHQHTLHLLTDCGDWFDFKSYEYNKEFSYYDKLIFLLDLMTVKKKRITYIDADKLKIYNNIEYDDSSVYTYNISHWPVVLDETYINVKNEIHNYLKTEDNYDIYAQEALISLPYTSDFENMKKDIIGLQPIIENTYHNRGGWKSPKLNRYSKHGKGFGEGSALTAVLFKYNLNIVSVYKSFRKQTII